VGLNGVGIKAVNALSSFFEIQAWREGKTKAIEFSKGDVVEEMKKPVADKESQSGTRLSFEVDRSIFPKNVKWKDAYVERMCRYYSFLNPGLVLTFNGKKYKSKHGLLDLLKEEMDDEPLYEPIVLKGKDIDVVFSHTLASGEEYYSFVNGQHTTQGGTHLAAFRKNSAAAEALQKRILQAERERKELSGVKKLSRDRARQAKLHNKKLRDCKAHYGTKHKRRDETTIFITEGDSASGSITKCRDVETQAVFSLRGKPLNTFGLSKKIVYENEEFALLQAALNIEDGLESLRYKSIVVATDADVDGMHIRLLLLTFFLQFFPEVIREGHLFILETPLFRVRNKKKTLYCYDIAEKDEALKELGKNAEITRFKGLGEISPDEFGFMIGPEMRLDPVLMEEGKSLKEMLAFYMGKNTPDRQSFIIEKLRHDVDTAEVA